MRLRALALAFVVSWAPAAHAHKQAVLERAILQFRPDATELLYELQIPAGADAAHWRLLFDANHDGRLSASEYGKLAQGLAEEVRAHLTLTLEGNALPVRVLDAKVTPSEAADGLSGRLSALVWLGAREMPPGLRKVEVSLAPVADPLLPVLVRLEAPRATVQSVVGVPRGEGDALALRKGLQATILLDVPAAKP